MLRIFSILFVLLAPAVAFAQPTSFQQSPLVCFSSAGVEEIMRRMNERTQIGALGNPASHDIVRNQSDCSYNDNWTSVPGQTVWMQTERWVILLEVVDVGNRIYMWRPADVQDRADWRLPRNCPILRPNTRGMQARAFLNQNIRMPAHCYLRLRR